MSLSADELAAIQELAAPFFNTPLQIFRPGVITPDPDAIDYVPEYDYGDDDLDYPDAEAGATPIATVEGWFFSALQERMSDDSAQLATINVQQVRLPVGTDIKPADIIKRTDNGDTFVVIDTNAEDSWPDMLRAELRRRE